MKLFDEVENNVWAKLALKDGGEKEIFTPPKDVAVDGGINIRVDGSIFADTSSDCRRIDIVGIRIISLGGQKINVMDVNTLVNLEWIVFDEDAGSLVYLKAIHHPNDINRLKKIENVPKDIRSIVCSRMTTITNMWELLDSGTNIMMM